jgi:hypothetical protein
MAVHVAEFELIDPLLGTDIDNVMKKHAGQVTSICPYVVIVVHGSA